MVAKVRFYPSDQVKMFYGEMWSSIKLRISRHQFSSGSKDHSILDWAPINRWSGQPEKWASELCREIRLLLRERKGVNL